MLNFWGKREKREREKEKAERKKKNTIKKGKTNFMVQILSWVEIKTTGEKE